MKFWETAARSELQVGPRRGAPSIQTWLTMDRYVEIRRSTIILLKHPSVWREDTIILDI